MKRVLITGGTSGIGLDTVLLLSQEKYFPIIIGSSDKSINKIEIILESHQIDCIFSVFSSNLYYRTNNEY